MANKKFTAENIRECLHYDPETGVFTWLTNQGGVQIGSIAGYRSDHRKNNKGYWKISDYMAHRLAWLYMTGSWPKGTIDHIDGDSYNNRFANFRDIPHIAQQQNRHRAAKHNQTGLLGVRINKNAITRPYYASIYIERKYHFLGSFAKPEEAHSAYVEAKRKIHEFGSL